VRGRARLMAGLGLALVLHAAGAASAADNASWEVVPTPTPARAGNPSPYLEYSSQPGDVVHDSVTVRNLTAAPLSFHLFATDAVNVPGDGAFALRPDSSPKVDVATWVHLSRDSLVLPGGAEAAVPFDLDVPPNATPGDHSGGIVAVDANPTDRITGGGGQITVVRGVGVRIYSRVAGPLHPGLQVAALSLHRSPPGLANPAGSGQARLNLVIANTGNLREAPTLRVRLTDLFGRQVDRPADRRLPDLLPGARLPVSEVIDGVPATGRVTARVELTTADVRVIREVQFWAVPWLGLGAVAAAVAVVGVTATAWRRRRATRHRPVASAAGPGHLAD